MDNNNCDIVQDLITLYVDELSSDESNKLIETHIGECHICKEFLQNIEEDKKIDVIENVQLSNETEKKLILDIKKSLIKSKLLFVVLGAILGVVFSTGEKILDGFMIIPLVGAIIYLVIRKVWVAPTLIAVLKLIEFGIYYTKEGYGEYYTSFLQYLIGYVPIVFIYVIFTLIGVLIGWLIKEIFLRK